MKNFFIKESVSDCNAAAAAATMREWCKSQDENWLAKKVITPPEQLQKDRLSGNRFSDAIFAQQSINELMNDASSSSLHCCGQTRVVQKKLLFLGSTGTVKVGTTKVCSSFKLDLPIANSICGFARKFHLLKLAQNDFAKTQIFPYLVKVEK